MAAAEAAVLPPRRVSIAPEPLLEVLLSAEDPALLRGASSASSGAGARRRQPSSRRKSRLHENEQLLSELSACTSQSEAESEQEEETDAADFAWTGHFSGVGFAFFEDDSEAMRKLRLADRLRRERFRRRKQRRLLRIMRKEEIRGQAERPPHAAERKEGAAAAAGENGGDEIELVTDTEVELTGAELAELDRDGWNVVAEVKSEPAAAAAAAAPAPAPAPVAQELSIYLALPRDLYRGIDRRARDVLRKAHSGHALPALEQLLCGFKRGTLSSAQKGDLSRGGEGVFEVLSWNDGVLRLLVAEAYHRLMLHGLCQFHLLQSGSCCDSSYGGARVTTVRPRRGLNSVFRPHSFELVHYLQGRYDDD
jgi:hypothetical protein